MDTSVLRILDASLNRATEGLRVVEDYTRFALNDRFLSAEAKAIRHGIANAGLGIDSADRSRARDTTGDVGADVILPTESARQDGWAVCQASLERAKQALRSLEEYSKLRSPTIAADFERLRYRCYTLEKAIITRATIDDRIGKSRLYVLVPGAPSGDEFRALVDSLVDAGVHALQLRDKTLDDRRLVERARLLVEATRGSRTLAIVNDRADVAVVAGADGVHVGQDEFSVADARAVVGAGQVVGVSTHSLEQARAAVLAGADYIGVGPTFPSETKSFSAYPGIDLLRDVARETSAPAFAIGGITAETLPAVLETGTRRVAVASAVTGADDPAAAARGLLAQLEEAP